MALQGDDGDGEAPPRSHEALLLARRRASSMVTMGMGTTRTRVVFESV